MANFNFEQQLKQLQDIVAKMEQSDLSLEDSMKNFENGLNIINKCQSELEKAQQKITILKEGKEVPFDKN